MLLKFTQYQPSYSKYVAGKEDVDNEFERFQDVLYDENFFVSMVGCRLFLIFSKLRLVLNDI